jgi:hypothetical protein
VRASVVEGVFVSWVGVRKRMVTPWGAKDWCQLLAPFYARMTKPLLCCPSPLETYPRTMAICEATHLDPGRRASPRVRAGRYHEDEWGKFG